MRRHRGCPPSARVSPHSPRPTPHLHADSLAPRVAPRVAPRGGGGASCLGLRPTAPGPGSSRLYGSGERSPSRSCARGWAPSPSSSRRRTQGAHRPFQGGPVPSLYLQQLEPPTVRLRTTSSSWSMKRSCFWAQARPWAGKATCTHWPGMPRAPSPQLAPTQQRRGLAWGPWHSKTGHGCGLRRTHSLRGTGARPQGAASSQALQPGFPSGS